MNTQKHPIKALLFDLDGTLVDSAPDLGTAANNMRTSRGLPPVPLENYRPFVGSGGVGMLKVAFNLNADAPDIESMKEEFYKNYEQVMLQGSNPFAGIPEIIKKLNEQKTPWGIVTNKVERFFHPIIKRAAWAHGAQALVGGDTTAHSKPHPDPILEGAKQLNIPVENCIYIGDDLRDIQAGKAAGTYTAVATWGYLGQVGHYDTWNADYQLKHINDILHLTT